MNKVLVTGASGFLGGNLVRELFRSGYEVKLLIRKSADISMLSDVPCEVCFGCIDHPGDVMEAVSGVDIVVHAACMTEQWGSSFEAYERINFTATKYIVEACRQQGVRKFIFVSTANTIGPGSRTDPGNELNGFTLFSAGSGYINSKYIAQQYVLEQAQKGFPAVVVNPTFMIGANDSKPSSGKMILYGLGRNVLFYPSGGKNFVHVQDVCRGIINAIARGRVGDCYLLAGDNLTYREFFNLLNRAARQNPVMIKIPAWLLRLAGYCGSLLEKIAGRSVRLNRTTAFLLCLDNYYSGRKSERELMMQYTPVALAITDAVRWFRERRYCG